MSDWHFGMDYDMWLYPPVDRTAPDYDELPEPIEAANIEGTLLVNAEDAIEQVHCLQAENAKLRELVRDMHKALFSLNLDYCQACPREDACVFVHKSFDCDECAFERDMRELGIEVGA